MIKRKIYLKRLLVFLLFVVFISCNKTDWQENFKEREKSPFGTYIFKNEAPILFKNQEVITLKENLYDYLFKNYTSNPSIFQTYLIVKKQANKFKKNSIYSLLNFVDEGNTAFLVLENIPQLLKDTLQFKTKNLDKDIYQKKLKSKQGSFRLNNSIFKTKDFFFDRNIRRNYFIDYAEENTTVLGTVNVDEEYLPNFIKIQFGKGIFYFHLHPIVFTNYNLLKGNTAYAEGILAYLPETKILWDEHIRSSKFNKKDKEKEKASVFSFFLAHESLTWFLYISLIGLLLFMLFNAKRKQRAIPVIRPLQNTTLAFIQTISGLYLKEENHKNLVDKKITFFLEKVRTRYLLNTTNLNKDFIEKLALKSGNSIQQTNYLVNTIKSLNKKNACSEEELIVLHKIIVNFLNKN